MSRLPRLLATTLSMGFGLGIGLLAAGMGRPTYAQDTATPGGEAEDEPTKKTADAKVVKTEDEWRKLLTPSQFLVTRMKETEAPFTGKYSRGHFNGTFLCVCCQAELFTSKTKFESGTGWPSFWQPIRKNAVATQWDYSEAEPRIEVTCHRCDAHLGHVFDDGPAPTGLRYCINSVAITLRPAATAAKGKAKAKAKSTRSKREGS